MAQTNFGLLTSNELTAWSREFWEQARNKSFVTRFTGTGPNAMIQKVTELTKTKKGAKAILTLLTDLEGDGVVGDRTLEGNEEVLKSQDAVILIDMLRNASRHEGKMAEQRSVVNFRETVRDKLSYWIADRITQMAFLSLGGIDYKFQNSAIGTLRTGSDLKNLDFNVPLAPTSQRSGRWNNTTKKFVVGGVTGDVITSDTPAWELFVQLKAHAKETYMRGIDVNGEETYDAFLTPMAFAKLKADATYRDNLRHAQTRGADNELFTGATVKIDNIRLHEHRHVPNNRLGVSGTSQWGSGLDIEGCQILFCGAQALGMADLGEPEWIEKEFDYGNQPGISVGKMLGFLKPQFTSPYTGSALQDHGVISAYVSQE
jgi:N4-gp56 family major capsid protein